MSHPKVIRFDCAFNDRLERGVVRIHLNDGSVHDFGEVSPLRFAALVQILRISADVYWNGSEKWLFTEEELTSVFKPST
jgi:hypothetical protein